MKAINAITACQCFRWGRARLRRGLTRLPASISRTVSTIDRAMQGPAVRADAVRLAGRI